MTSAEARELRATLNEALDPLYAARVGTYPAVSATERAIEVLQRIDDSLRTALYHAQLREDAETSWKRAMR